MVGSRTWWWCLPAVFAVGCANVDADVDLREQQQGLVCGMDVLPSPQTVPATACENGRTVFGPTVFTRDRGTPQAEVATFDVETAGDVCVTVRNSAISSGHVTINGSAIASPSSFGRDVALIEAEVAATAGANTLDVLLASGPGRTVEIEVREQFTSLNTGLDLVNDDGSLRLTNVATDHPLLTPNGDGHHDETFFNADVEPLNVLPGKDDGTVDYFLQWEFSIVSLDTCTTVDTGITGSTQVNSPTRVTAVWDGTDSFGAVVGDGTYSYVFHVSLVDEFGTFFGAIDSPAYAFSVDSAPANYDEAPAYLGACDPISDPTNCRCPGSGGVPGSMDPNCSFGMIQHLLDGSGFPPGTLGNFYDPSVIDLSFITTTQDAGRYRVSVDLQTVFSGGLVAKGDGVWDSEAELRQWVADMTGVPLSTGDSLFNFDYVQLGTSTGVQLLGKANHSFNHFLLDAMTDDNGQITIDGVTTDLAARFNDDAFAPSQYSLDGRADDECSHSASTNGGDELRAKFCANNSAVSIGSATDLGVYALRTSLFGIEFNGNTATQDELCLLNGIFSCGIRTIRVPADSLQIESTYFADAGGVTTVVRTDTAIATDLAAISLVADRGDGTDGVCARGVATRDGLVVRIDSADGAVPGTCLINGIIPY